MDTDNAADTELQDPVVDGQRSDRPFVVLAESEALELAASASVGRIVHVLDDRLCVAPVNFRLEGQDVLIRTAEGTELLAAARRQASAALQVDNIVDWSRSGWSVLIRGHLAEVTEPDAVERVLSSGLRPWLGENRDHVVRLSGNEVTGRRIEPGPGVISVIRL